MKRPRLYVGATKHATLADVRRLSGRWALQEKVDGCYARVCLDSQGRIGRVFSRSDREIHRDQLAGILGAFIGWPHAELVGELEAHTEAGNAAAAARGQRLVHLFDCLHDGTRSLALEPYHRRRDALFRMQSEVVNFGPDAPWLRDAAGSAHDRKSGRYTRASLTGWRVAPIVPQAPLTRLDALWEEVVRDGGREGLVAVNLDATVGRASSKLRVKPYETIDAVVVHVSRTTVIAKWNGQPFAVGRGRHIVDPGEVVEVRHAGWYGTAATPRFPALVRVRRDLH